MAEREAQSPWNEANWLQTGAEEKPRALTTSDHQATAAAAAGRRGGCHGDDDDDGGGNGGYVTGRTVSADQLEAAKHHNNETIAVLAAMITIAFTLQYK